MENTLSPDYKHREHIDWASRLNFYEDEIRIFEKDLLRVAAKHPDLRSIEEHVAEYRNLFASKLKTIEIIRNQISMHESEIARQAKMQLSDMHNHAMVREMMASLEYKFGQLKINFRRFVSRND